MRPQVSWATAEERRLIVDQALELLGTVGMRLGAGESLERLAEAGARVNHEVGVARERAYGLVAAAEARGPVLSEGVRETLRAIVAVALAAERATTGG